MASSKSSSSSGTRNKKPAAAKRNLSKSVLGESELLVQDNETDLRLIEEDVEGCGLVLQENPNQSKLACLLPLFLFLKYFTLKFNLYFVNNFIKF